MKKFKQVYANKFQRLDESRAVHLTCIKRCSTELTHWSVLDKTERNIQQVEERVAFSLSKHSLHTEEMVGASGRARHAYAKRA